MIEVEKIVRPVSAENPSGESLRYSVVYDQIKAARREDDPDLAQGIWQTKLKKADWQEVKDVCLETLENRSKDLQIAAWLLEACIHLDGFAGAADGFRVLTSLCEGFWDTLYPQIDPDDPEFRFGPMVWIDEKLSLKLKLVPITKPKSGDETAFAWADWEHALHMSKIGAKEKPRKPGAEPKERLLPPRVMASSAMTPVEFYVDLKQQIASALDETIRCEQVLVKFDHKQDGALYHTKETLRTIGHFVGEVLRDRGAEVTTHVTTQPEIEISIPEEPEPDMAANEQRDYPLSGPIRSRAQAYQMLSEAAEYLMKTEPHSPTPYLVKRAVAWGGMTLGELLQQVLRNPGELTELNRLLGFDELPGKKEK